MISFNPIDFTDFCLVGYQPALERSEPCGRQVAGVLRAADFEFLVVESTDTFVKYRAAFQS